MLIYACDHGLRKSGVHFEKKELYVNLTRKKIKKYKVLIKFINMRVWVIFRGMAGYGRGYLTSPHTMYNAKLRVLKVFCLISFFQIKKTIEII